MLLLDVVSGNQQQAGDSNSPTKREYQGDRLLHMSEGGVASKGDSADDDIRNLINIHIQHSSTHLEF